MQSWGGKIKDRIITSLDLRFSFCITDLTQQDTLQFPVEQESHQTAHCRPLRPMKSEDKNKLYFLQNCLSLGQLSFPFIESIQQQIIHDEVLRTELIDSYFADLSFPFIFFMSFMLSLQL